jgi:ATP-dependent exoDNAse (exonuclease V) alpha subunit
MSDEETTVDRETVEGAVGRVLFSNDENGWCAVRLQPEDGASVTAIGPLLGVRQGDELRVTGRWVNHTKYGEQFEVESYVHLTPSTLEGLRRFLGSGKIRGLGPARAAQIVEEFGLDSLNVLDQEPERLLEIRGIGPSTVERVRESWEKHRGIQQIMIFLTGHGVAPGIAVKAFKKYGAGAVDVVRKSLESGSSPRTASRASSGSRTTPRNDSRPGFSTRWSRLSDRATALFRMTRSWQRPPTSSKPTSKRFHRRSPASSRVSRSRSFPGAMHHRRSTCLASRRPRQPLPSTSPRPSRPSLRPSPSSSTRQWPGTRAGSTFVLPNVNTKRSGRR